MFCVKKVLLSCLLFFSLVLTSHANRDFKLDAQATAKAPWKVGTEVARVENSVDCRQNYKRIPDCAFYRKFVGISIDGYYVVQDFYDLSKVAAPYKQTLNIGKAGRAGDERYSSPYLIMSKEKVGDTAIWSDPLGTQNIVGIMTLWHVDGNIFAEFLYPESAYLKRATVWNEKRVKIMEVTYGDDKIHGVARIWRDDGSKEAEGGMKGSGSSKMKHGPTILWYPNGQKRVQGSYRDNVKVGLWRTWDEQGKLVKEENMDGR